MSLVIIPRSTERIRHSKYVQPTSVSYTADVHGHLALCKLTQTYLIPVDIDESSYRFPVDYNSAFCDLTIITPRETIKGVVKEKSEAKQVYAEAKKKGYQVFMTEESETDCDIYKLSMANVNKGDTITVEYTYITQLEAGTKSNTFYIPSFISPRFGAIEHIPSATHNIGATIKIYNKSARVSCVAPNVQCHNATDAFVVEYKSDQVMEHDIEVIIETEHEQSAYRFNYDGVDIKMMQFMPQAIDNNCRELTFILDCSGSMDGGRIENSKKAIIHCLEKMRKSAIQPLDYKFNIIQYGSDVSVLLPKLVPNSDSYINTAIKHCKSISANMGGTYTGKALAKCLERCRTAILITDGDTSDNHEIHELCKKFDCLSVLGIGTGFNRANVSDMAKYGSGIARFSQTGSNIAQNIELLFSSITCRCIPNYKINWEGCNASLASTRTIIYGHPNVIYSILFEPSVQQSFVIDAAQINLPIKPLDIPIDHKFVAALAARRIIQENNIGENILTKERATELAVKFSIITPYTSMIAVGTKISNDDPMTDDSSSGKEDEMYEEDDDMGCDMFDSYTQDAAFSAASCMFSSSASSNSFSFNVPENATVATMGTSKSSSHSLAYMAKSSKSCAKSSAKSLGVPAVKTLSNQDRSTLFRDIFYAMGDTVVPDAIDTYFDTKLGMVMKSVTLLPVFSSLPAEIASNPTELTLFVMYFLYYTDVTVFDKYKSVIKQELAPMLADLI